MPVRGKCKMAVSFAVAVLAVAAPLIAGQIKGEIKSIDRASSQAVLHDEETNKDVTVNLAALAKSVSSRLGKGVDVFRNLRPGVKVVVNEGIVASSVEIDVSKPTVRGPILQEFWRNFTHNLFKPLL